MKKVILFFFLGLLVLWVTGIILENFFNVDLDKYIYGNSAASQAAAPAPAAAQASDTASTPETLPSDWKTYSNSDFHFSISGPYEWKDSDSSLPRNVKGIVAKGSSLDLKFTIRASAIEMPNADFDLNGAMEMEIKMFKIQDKIMQNFQMSTSPVTVADTPGILGQGSYQVEGKMDQEIKILKVKKGTTMLDVSCQYQPTDENKAMADKILHSLTFSN